MMEYFIIQFTAKSYSVQHVSGTDSHNRY